MTAPTQEDPEESTRWDNDKHGPDQPTGTDGYVGSGAPPGQGIEDDRETTKWEHEKHPG